MRFGHHRQGTVKRSFIRPAASRNADINVTPLVDVVLVLLIIFMVVTPLLEKNIPVSTPSSEKVEEVAEVPPDQLVVYINRTGQLRINADNVSAAEYIGKLKQRLDLHAPNDRIVFIVAEDELNYAKLIAAIDGAKQAGAEILGFATDPPDPAMFPTGG
jgi:biopolymer transport protein ExbD